MALKGRRPQLIRNFGLGAANDDQYGLVRVLIRHRTKGRPAENRSLHEEAAKGALQEQAIDVLARWIEKIPGGVEPKY